MDTFDFTNGSLCCDSHSLSDIADQFGTPVYVYSARAFREHYAALRDAFAVIEPRLCFSIKSCHNVHILRTLLECGSSFDAVSIGEVRRALEAGAKASDIVFAGVGKTPAEIEAAVGVEPLDWLAEEAFELVEKTIDLGQFLARIGEEIFERQFWMMLAHIDSERRAIAAA